MEQDSRWIIDHIPEGQKNAQSMTYIAKIMGVDRREVRKAVENARASGSLICSGNKGYWMPETLDEAKEYVNAQLSRIRTGRKVIQPFLEAIREEERNGRRWRNGL